MIRLLSLAAAFAASTLVLGASSAQAGTTPRFVATPVAAPAQARVVTGETLWRQANGTLVAAQAGVGDMVGCQQLARGVGRLSSFTAKGRAFDAAELDRCNAKARNQTIAVADAR